VAPSSRGCNRRAVLSRRRTSIGRTSWIEKARPRKSRSKDASKPTRVRSSRRATAGPTEKCEELLPWTSKVGCVQTGGQLALTLRMRTECQGRWAVTARQQLQQPRTLCRMSSSYCHSHSPGSALDHPDRHDTSPLAMGPQVQKQNQRRFGLRRGRSSSAVGCCSLGLLGVHRASAGPGVATSLSHVTSRRWRADHGQALHISPPCIAVLFLRESDDEGCCKAG